MPFPAVTRIATPRLVIRPIEAADLPDLLAINGDEEVTRFLPYATWTSIDDGTAWFDRMQGIAATGTAQQLVIEHVPAGRVIGTLLLFKYEASSSRLELGYALGRSHWRQGLAKEALRGICTHLFRDRSIRRLEAEVNPANQASCALLQGLGFAMEGRLRKRWVSKGQAYDIHFYGCLAEEWTWPARVSAGSNFDVGGQGPHDHP